MSNSLNLSNNEVGFFNDVILLKNTGQSSIYDIFGSKTDVSNLGSINTTTLSQITNIVSNLTSFSTLNSALATKANITDVYYQNTTNSLFYNKSYLDNKFGIQDTTLTAYGNTLTFHSNTLGSIITDATINSKLLLYADKVSFNSLSDFVYIIDNDKASIPYVNLVRDTLNTSVSNLSTTVAQLTTNVNNTITAVSNLNITTSSIITELSSVESVFGGDIGNIKSTLPSFLQITKFNSTIGSYLTTNNFSSSSLLNTTAFNTTLTSRLTTYSTITSVSNINATIPTLLSISGFTSASLLNINAFNNTLTSNLSSYTPLSIYNNTITTRLNSQATSITNINTTIPSLITSTTLTSNLNTKQNKNVFSIPDVSSSWIQLGSISTAQTGNITVIEIYSQNGYNAFTPDECRATIQFSTANGSSYINGADSTPFYGIASLISTNNITANYVSIQQSSTTSYSFFFFTGGYPGSGFFNVKTNDTFTYSGTTLTPSGCYINPNVVYTVGLNGSGSGNMYVDRINSGYFLSTNATYSIYDNSSINLANFNNGGSTILSNLNVSGNSVSRSISCTSLFVSGAETVLSTLNVSGNFAASSISGTSLFISGSETIGTNLNSIGNLFVSGNTTLRSALNVNLGITCTNLSVLGNITSSGPSHILNASALNGDVSLSLKNLVSGTTSLYFNNNNTLQSRIYTDAIGNMNLSCYTGTSFIKFYCGTSPFFQITNAGGANISDARFKTNVSTITDSISTISQLQGVKFSMISDTTNTIQMGFIADAVKLVVPEVVVPSVDENGDELNFIVYCKLTALLVEGIKQQQQMINNNISSISSLNSRVSVLEGV